MANISFVKVNKIYDNGYHAVKDFNLEIKDGEFIVFVGPSGCGKSTTLRMLAGLEEISDGDIKIGDKVINKVDPSKRDIAMVFQNYALYPHMTVYQNMEYALKNQKVPKEDRDKKIKAAARLLEIEDFLDRKPGRLSGGQNQRVALGRALVRNPQVFLMDEPLSNLDAKLRAYMRTEINKIHKQLETTFIYVTHDQTEAMTLGDRIVVMNDGVIQQVDTPNNLYNNPNNIFVAGFIGSPKINLIKTSIKEVDGQIKLMFNEKEIPIKNSVAEKLKNYKDNSIYIGLRPEHMYLEENTNREERIPVKINIIENLGSETIFYTDFENEEIIARDFGNNNLEENFKINLYYDSENILFFDSKSGMRILV